MAYNGLRRACYTYLLYMYSTCSGTRSESQIRYYYFFAQNDRISEKKKNIEVPVL